MVNSEEIKFFGRTTVHPGCHFEIIVNLAWHSVGTTHILFWRTAIRKTNFIDLFTLVNKPNSKTFIVVYIICMLINVFVAYKKICIYIETYRVNI